MPARKKRASAAAPLPFNRRLVVHQWLLSLFGVRELRELATLLGDEALEGLDENGVHHFHHQLTTRFFNLTALPAEKLLAYDQHIVRHTRQLNERRLLRGEAPLVWKYFQYLALLFTEIWLDRCLNDPAALRAELNTFIEAWNADVPEGSRVDPFSEDEEPGTQLNKLAFWMATGAGKTLVMHANLLQYRHWLAAAGRARELNRVILLTPNDGLSQQHLREFEASGIAAELFVKDGRGLFAGEAVEIIEVTRLREEMGEKTVAVDAFEGNNLVLVDEGHRGASAGTEGTWMKYRDRLCERGFSFEYSATFGQAVKGSEALAQRYARIVLFDYSYRWFYEDGFGKDYQILNLDENTQAQHRQLYLTACLLSFHQQLRLYRDRERELRPFQLERPLWVFVGSRVTESLATKDASDIVEILQFLDGYARDRAGSTECIRRILGEGLVTAGGTNLFGDRFGYLQGLGLTPEQLFDDTLAAVFNAPAGGALHVALAKGADGELALTLGAADQPFGVINVGDAAKLRKLCAEAGLDTTEREFAGSLFHAINDAGSPITLLVGSKKFTEGWSSWRVATMGLMNVGRSEGAQIIQLFGRGVRLKGYRTSLKRSARAPLPTGVERPRHIALLETLGIFGIRADYMAQFREFLEEEGLPGDDDREEIVLPVIRNLGTVKLRTVRLKKSITVGGTTYQTEFGRAFRELGPVPQLQRPDEAGDLALRYFVHSPVVLNRYPQVQALRSDGVGAVAGATPHEAWFRAEHLAFLDWDALYFELERFRAERGWYNLNLSRAAMRALLADNSWYRIQIPAAELGFDDFGKVRRWQEIALALLKKYTERYYTFRKREWEEPHLEYRDLDEGDPNLLGVSESVPDGGYRILIQRSQQDIADRLRELKAMIAGGQLAPWSFGGLTAMAFGRHLYQPLLHLDGAATTPGLIDITPAPLNRGERQFVEDLRAFHEGRPAFFTGRQLYLLRNLSRGKGVGFFEAGNFHPDFILWLLDGATQHVVFVDPKGLRNLDAKDPKVEFHRTIKEIEQRLADPAVKLASFIVSNTPAAPLALQWGVTKEEMTKRHILFQEDQGVNGYVKSLLEAVVA